MVDLLRAGWDEAQVIMLGVVGKVLRVEGCKRQIMDETACSDPTVVYGAGTAAELGVGLHLAPLDGYGFVEGKQDNL